jgi:hypothetical protein
MPNYQEKVSDILQNMEGYHAAFYAGITAFRGPSLFFHRQSLETQSRPDFIRHLEYVYATLASWGMHRMGPGGSKMQDFATFKNSVEPLRDKIGEAQQIDYREVTSQNLDTLEEIFKGINIMVSGTSIVGNSKVMAHMVPNIVPPIDRQYTLKYLRGNTSIKNDLNYEWSLLKEIISEFFIPVASDVRFIAQANVWIANQTDYPWDTSILKVIDNLVIGTGK